MPAVSTKKTAAIKNREHHDTAAPLAAAAKLYKSPEELGKSVITRGSVRRLGHRAGLKRSKNPKLTKALLPIAHEYVRTLMRYSVVHAMACGRITVDTIDTIKALKLTGSRVVGSGYGGASTITSSTGTLPASVRSRRSKPQSLITKNENVSQ